jgi:hypothetical protein
MNTMASIVPGFWGRSAATRVAAAQNMKMALVTEGEGPTRARYSAARMQAPGFARLLPSSGPRSTAVSPASTLTCWPDRARIWAQPASLKALTRLVSSSSRTPRNKASRRGPASPPALPRADSRPARMPSRSVSAREGGLRKVMSPRSTKTLAPARGRRSAGGRHRTRTVLPLGGADEPRTNTVSRPVAPTLA